MELATGVIRPPEAEAHQESGAGFGDERPACGYRVEASAERIQQEKLNLGCPARDSDGRVGRPRPEASSPHAGSADVSGKLSQVARFRIAPPEGMGVLAQRGSRRMGLTDRRCDASCSLSPITPPKLLPLRRRT